MAKHQSKEEKERKSKIMKKLWESKKFRIKNKGRKGQKNTKEHNLKISKKLKGRIFSKKTKKKISNTLKGTKRLEETKKKISNTLKGTKRPKHISESSRKNILNLWKNKNYYNMMIKINLGKNNPSWRGGISKLPYSKNWSLYLRKKIKKRDSFMCILCNKKNPIKLAIHHIDYNKKNSSENNLISLCMNCHTKTNHNRKYWKNLLNNLMVKLYG